MNKESIFKGWKFLKPKSGGANEAGEHGGVYQNIDGNVTAMIKQESSPAKNMAEFLGSQIFAAINPGDGAKVTLMIPDDFKKGNDSQIYVKSEFFKNYSSDMYVDMDRHMSSETKPSSWFKKDGGRPLFIGSRNKLFKTLENAFKEVKYQNFENIMPASLLIGDFDVHIGNIGVIRDPKKSEVLPKLVRIDFAGSLNKLTNNIHPHSRSKHLPGFGPTNHFREFPSYLRRNPEFTDSLIKASKVDLSKTIDESFGELTKYYSNDAIAEFAKQAMPNLFRGKGIKIITPEEIKTQLKQIIETRQESLRKYGLEIKLTNLISKKYTYPYYEVQKEKLRDLMQEYPEYFKKTLDFEENRKGKNKLKLRIKTPILTKILEALGVKLSARKQLIKTIKDLNEESKQTVISKKEYKQKTVKINEDREYVERLEKFKKESKKEDIDSILPSQLGLSKKIKKSNKKSMDQKDLIDSSKEAKITKIDVPTKNKFKEKKDLLEFDKKDLEAIKHLKEEVLKTQKVGKVKDKEIIHAKDAKNKRELG